MATKKKQFSANMHEFTFSFQSFHSNLTIAQQPYSFSGRKEIFENYAGNLFK